MSSIYPVEDGDEKRIFKKDAHGNYFEIGNDSENFYEESAEVELTSDSEKKFSKNREFNNAYPQEVLLGGGPAVKWIRGLTKEQLHLVINEKNIALPLLVELARNAPLRYLKNLAQRNDVPVDIRISILRRIFRAKTDEMNNENKLKTYKEIIAMKTLSKKEIRVTNSYIQEIEKLLNVKSTPDLQNKNRKKNNKKQIIQKRKVEIQLKKRPDTDLQEIARYLSWIRTEDSIHIHNSKENIETYKIQAHLLADKFCKKDSIIMNSVGHLLTLEDLISFRTEINNGFHSQNCLIPYLGIIDNYHLDFNGQFAKNFINEFNGLPENHDLLFGLMLKAISTTQEDFNEKMLLIQNTSNRYEELLNDLPPRLNVGEIKFRRRGNVIEGICNFSSSPNLRISETSLKFWRYKEDEDSGFPNSIQVKFDYEKRIYECESLLTNLQPDKSYFVGISAAFDGYASQEARIEFRVPELQDLPLPDSHWQSSKHSGKFEFFTNNRW